MPRSVKAVARRAEWAPWAKKLQVELETCGQLANVTAADVTASLSSPQLEEFLSCPGVAGGNPDSRDKSMQGRCKTQ